MACGEWRKWRRYMVELWAASALYGAAVFATVWVHERYAPQGAWALGLAVIPVIPALLMLWAFLRQFWRMDELQRRVVAEAIVVTAGVVGFGSFALGWVIVIVQPAHPVFHFLPLVMVLPAMCAVLGPALVFVKRRYL